jgi:hypothetical protein
MGEELFPGSEVADRDGRIQTGLGLFVPCGLRAGAQGRNRTTNTRFFSRDVDRFFNKINMLQAPKQSVLRSVLGISHWSSGNYCIFTLIPSL